MDRHLGGWLRICILSGGGIVGFEFCGLWAVGCWWVVMGWWRGPWWHRLYGGGVGCGMCGFGFWWAWVVGGVSLGFGGSCGGGF